MIAALIPLLAPILGKVLDKIPNKDEREKVRLEMELQLAQIDQASLMALIEVDKAQAAINQTEAASSDKFRSYPRPLAMWICVGGLAWEITAVIVTQFFSWFHQPIPQIVHLPEFLTGTLLCGLLGLSGLRSHDIKAGTRI